MTPLLTRIKEDSEGSQSPLTAELDIGTPHKMGNSKKESQDPLACEEGPGLCAMMLTIVSLLLIVVSLPLSLFCVVKVVQEYERAVIFRLGRLLTGGARGPGVFFIIPCVDVYEKI